MKNIKLNARGTVKSNANRRLVFVCTAGAMVSPVLYYPDLSKYYQEGDVCRIWHMRYASTCILASIVFLAISSRAKADIISTSAGTVEITPIQHASLILRAAGKLIYVDPSPAATFANKPKADLIIITDIHADHMDPDAIRELSKQGTRIIAPAAVQKTIKAAEVLNNGQRTSWDRWSIEAVPMYNIKRGPAPGKLFHTKGRGNGYVLTYGGTRFYISGDTEGIPEMRGLKNIDVAFVCMNQPYTMTPEEAADAVKAFHPKIVYPYHYRGQDTQQFAKLLEGSGIDVRLREWYAK
jgi:L-ascorbate metabolism protein UlaG (beta-lactamase superfamily)